MRRIDCKVTDPPLPAVAQGHLVVSLRHAIACLAFGT